MTSKFLLLMLLSALVCNSTASKRLLSQKGPFEDEKMFVPKRGLGGQGGNGNGGGVCVANENGANVVRGTGGSIAGGGEFASMIGDAQEGGGRNGNGNGNGNTGNGNGNGNGNTGNGNGNTGNENGNTGNGNGNTGNGNGNENTGNGNGNGIREMEMEMNIHEMEMVM